MVQGIAVHTALALHCTWAPLLLPSPAAGTARISSRCAHRPCTAQSPSILQSLNCAYQPYVGPWPVPRRRYRADLQALSAPPEMLAALEKILSTPAEANVLKSSLRASINSRSALNGRCVIIERKTTIIGKPP